MKISFRLLFSLVLKMKIETEVISQKMGEKKKKVLRTDYVGYFLKLQLYQIYFVVDIFGKSRLKKG